VVAPREWCCASLVAAGAGARCRSGWPQPNMMTGCDKQLTDSMPMSLRASVIGSMRDHAAIAASRVSQAEVHTQRHRTSLLIKSMMVARSVAVPTYMSGRYEHKALYASLGDATRNWSRKCGSMTHSWGWPLSSAERTEDH
jgi:hypothetical protein